MTMLGYVALFIGVVACLHGFLLTGTSDEFKVVVTLTSTIALVAGAVAFAVVMSMSLFGGLSEKDDTESDSNDNEDEESTDFDPPNCEACGNSDRWIFDGQTEHDLSDRHVALNHVCLCGHPFGGLVSHKNRSSYLKKMPTFFDVSDGTWLEERYNQIKKVIAFQEQLLYCDHPGCPNIVNVVGCLFPEMNISLYLDGSCTMVPSKDDDEKLIKKDFCKDHIADGQYTFVVCNWDRVGIEPVQRDAPIAEQVQLTEPVQRAESVPNTVPLEDTDEDGTDDGSDDNGTGDNESSSNVSVDKKDDHNETEQAN
jgi:hypothetical protein